MERLQIQATKSTPGIDFDPTTGTMCLSGESYPENSYEFFKPILSWIARTAASGNGPMTLEVRLSYLNTGSTKCMMDILDLLEESFLGGRNVKVNWHCDEDNERGLETAEEFKEEVTLPFNILPIPKQP